MKKVIALILTLTLGFLLCTSAVASTSPLAELYFYNHGELSGLKTLDSTTCATLTEGAIDNAGYNCVSYTNVPAGPSSSGSVIRTLDDDAIFFISGHAGKGRVYCVDNYGNVTIISANADYNDNSVYSLEYNFENTTAKLRSLRIAYWMGCNTYGTDSTYGSLNGKCTTLGVDCNITHSQKTWPIYSNYFLYCFAFYGDQGQTVSTALANAKSWCYSYYGSYEGSGNEVDLTLGSYVIRGTTGYSSVKFEPAGYGTY